MNSNLMTKKEIDLHNRRTEDLLANLCSGDLCKITYKNHMSFSKEKYNNLYFRTVDETDEQKKNSFTTTNHKSGHFLFLFVENANSISKTCILYYFLYHDKIVHYYADEFFLENGISVLGHLHIEKVHEQ